MAYFAAGTVWPASMTEQQQQTRVSNIGWLTFLQSPWFMLGLPTAGILAYLYWEKKTGRRKSMLRSNPSIRFDYPDSDCPPETRRRRRRRRYAHVSPSIAKRLDVLSRQVARLSRRRPKRGKKKKKK